MIAFVDGLSRRYADRGQLLAYLGYRTSPARGSHTLTAARNTRESPTPSGCRSSSGISTADGH